MGREQIVAELEGKYSCYSDAASWHSRGETMRYLLHQHLSQKKEKKKVYTHGFGHCQNWQLPQPSVWLTTRLGGEQEQPCISPSTPSE